MEKQNKNLVVICDMDEVFSRGSDMPARISQRQKEGVEVRIAANNMKVNGNDIILSRYQKTFDIDFGVPITKDVVGFKKGDKPYWPSLLQNLKLEAENIIFIGSKQREIDQAREAGVSGIFFEENRIPYAINELDTELANKGFNPG